MTIQNDNPPIISDDDAKHIASNPDGVDVDDLTAFLRWFAQHGTQHAADVLTDSHKPYAEQIKNYVTLSNAGRRWRLAGKIALALNEEQNAQTAYMFLPKKYQW